MTIFQTENTYLQVLTNYWLGENLLFISEMKYYYSIYK